VNVVTLVDTLPSTRRGHDAVIEVYAEPRLDRVVVINDVSVMSGGATGVALSSLELLAAQGVPITFIVGDDGVHADPRSRVGEFLAFGCRHILDRGVLDAAVSGLYNARAEKLLSRWIAANDTPRTIYHLHGWSKVLSPAVFRALRPVARRVVITAHDFFLVCPNGGYFNFRSEKPCRLRPMGLSCLLTACDRRNYAHKVWRWVRLGIQRILLDLGEDVGTVLAVHDGMIDHLVRGGVPRHKLRVLRNSVVPWRSARVEAERNRTFTFVGRLEREKGIDLLARAARVAGVPLRIIGRGPLAAPLAAEFPEVEQVGWKTQAEISALISDTRVVAMPSRCRESLGLAALEALTSGVPAVISDHAMISQEVANAGFGFACDPHDEALFASVLMKLAQDDALVASMSRRAYSDAWRLACTPPQWAADLMCIYRGLLQPEPA